ncbi:glycosyltransferase family 2 protein [Ulvibacter antarcticus]|uniref:GT2 family glycosyltransferase n=1 Tax=Ulvibacter antarcticus TaxID=442714 RepID=A0A3L9YBJ9_9FLAO|nr:glycosyltransferase [Ulvibacter antarcticus]RMA56730.1 GT2 family glycosyltransferase [Ulvibacter antarcticus]
MLSILIPTYNYNVFPLAEKLAAQAEKLAITFEIVVFDDCSPKPPTENESINSLPNATYKILEKNIGRSAIRNLLAKTAAFDTLIFLDADTMLISEDYISDYLEALESTTQIIYGGIVYQSEMPPEDEILRWAYGNAREALPLEERLKKPHLSFLTLSFLIKKDVFKIMKFNEEIPNLRHEDTLFALDAKKNNIRVQHIDNPVMHLGLETSSVFLRKSNEAVEALRLFVKDGLIKAEETRLSQFADKINRLHLSGGVRWIYRSFRKKMEVNLLSSKPSLFVFDVYRLGYYLTKSTA